MTERATSTTGATLLLKMMLFSVKRVATSLAKLDGLNDGCFLERKAQNLCQERLRSLKDPLDPGVNILT